MTAVWYTGRSDKRTITSAQWAAAGIAGAADVTWDKSNGYSVPASSLTAPQLSLLGSAGGFQVNAPDGPRDGGVVVPGDAPSLKYADLTALGVDAKQLKRRFQSWKTPPGNSYVGPALSGDDLPVITTGAAGDAVTYNQQYQNGVINDRVSAYGLPTIMNNNVSAKTSQSGIATVTTYRFMTDANRFSLFTYAGGFVIDVYVNGKPLGTNPLVPAASTGFAPYGFNNFVFPTDGPRLIELRGIGGIGALFVPTPYRVWKPPIDTRPKLTVTGDSFVAPTVMSDTAAGGASELYNNGAYQRLPMLLGTPSLVTDGIGGSGYIVGGGAGMPYTHETRKQWVVDRNPDVHIVHGGFANDLYNPANYTLQQCVNAAVAYFKEMRTRLPETKFVFVEGFAPPLAGFAENNADYAAGRTLLQAALSAEGLYYIDVATTEPWLTNVGFVTGVSGAGNSNIYVGSDACHPTVKGNRYIRHRLAAKLQKVLADDGTLLNTLI